MVRMINEFLVSMEKDMASVRDTMTLLDVSRPTILRWLADGRFPNAKKESGVTGEWNIPRQDIEAIRQELVADLRRQINHLEELAAIKRQ